MSSEILNKPIKYKTLGIRRENKNKWERRVAITPSDVEKLIKEGIRVIFQPCNLRCYTNKQYLDVGAEMNEDLSEADVILGVKEVPLDLMIKDKTFLFFSHTFKGQSHNMTALDKLLEQNIRLIDYELIKENPKLTNTPNRLVAFGRYAGIVGAIDFIQGIGLFLMYKNIYTPLLHTGFSYMYSSLSDAKEAIIKVGELIKRKKINTKILPLIFGVTGNGRVANGCVEILELLPHKWIDPDDLWRLFEETTDLKEHKENIYLTRFESKHMYRLKNHEDEPTEKFDKNHFYQNKSEYLSIFSKKYLSYISVLFHCMYWDSESPIIISDAEASELISKGKLRLLGITDITCDYPISSIELLKKLTKIENPFYSIDPKTGHITEDFNNISNDSILYHSVDHLPSELPFDSSNHFSEKLNPFMKSILLSEYPSEYNEESLPVEILNAVETWNGKLCPKYSYLYKDLEKQLMKKY